MPVVDIKLYTVFFLLNGGINHYDKDPVPSNIL
jgi:hypothetical protein